MLVKFPPLYRINIHENGNSVVQLSLPALTVSATIQPYSEGRVKGFVVAPQDNSAPALVITNSARPGSSFNHALRLRIATPAPKSTIPLDLSKGRWIIHPNELATPKTLADYELHALATKDSWRGAFEYKGEDVASKIDGLRPPQMGAIHAIQSHWTVSGAPATIVLPTGVGKTETMLSALVAEQCHRLLVVVPTDVLRTQIADKFISFGLLKSPRFQIVTEQAMYPVVGILNHRPRHTNTVDLLFKKCNVIVTTMALASQCMAHVITKMTEHCQYLFIDEAHHVGAPKWREFRDAFKKSRIIQFTATPFRNDDKPVDGRRIYTFPLRKAQEQGQGPRI